MCYSPIYLKSKDIYVDCRKCFECRQKIAREWSIRLCAELGESPHSLFITLTFSDDYYDTATLCKSDVQLFLKRLRKSLKSRKIKYFAVGEYGDLTHRKHYHLILFNVYFFDIDVIKKCWYYGNVDIGAVQFKSISYVTGYVNKKISDSESDDFEEAGFVPAFRLMSKNLGTSFIYKNFDEYIREMSFTFSGKKFPIPRYFRQKLGLISDNPEYSDFIDKKIFDHFLNLSQKLSLEFDGDISAFVEKLYNIGYFDEREILSTVKNKIYTNRSKI